MEVSIFVGFLIANLGIPAGYMLTRWLPDEQAYIERLFKIKHQFLFVGLAGILAAFYPQPITAGVLFVYLLIAGSSVASWNVRNVMVLWLCSTAVFVVPYVIKSLS